MTPERTARIQHVLNHRQPNLTLVLENVFDPRNVTAIMRTCDSVGIMEIYVVNTLPVFQQFKKEYNFRSGRSASKWVELHLFTDLETCAKAVRAKYHKMYCTHLSSDAKDLYSMDFATESMALVLGNEQHGVSEELLQMCDGNFIIPQVGMIKSLNISVACAVTLYEAFRQKKLAGHYNAAQLAKSEKALLKKEW